MSVGFADRLVDLRYDDFDRVEGVLDGVEVLVGFGIMDDLLEEEGIPCDTLHWTKFSLTALMSLGSLGRGRL